MLKAGKGRGWRGLNTGSYTAPVPDVILTLFGAGDDGGWWDISDLSTLKADTAGTTPAVLNGPVGKILDKSGKGNHLVGDGTNFGTLKQDGGGHYYIDVTVNGTDYGYTNGTADLLQFGAAVSKADDANYACLVRLGLDGSQNLIMSNDWMGEWRTDIAGGMFNNATSIRVNGAVGYAYTEGEAIPHVVTATKANANGSGGGVYFLSTNGSDAPYRGRLYAAFVISRVLTSPELTTLEGVLAAKAGVTFP